MGETGNFCLPRVSNLISLLGVLSWWWLLGFFLPVEVVIGQDVHPHDTPETALDLSDRFSPLLGEGSQTISVEGEWKGATGDAEFEECGGDSSRPGVWFRFRLPLSDSPVVVTVDTCTGTSADTVLGVVSGAACLSDSSACECEGWNDQTCFDQSRVSLRKAAGSDLLVIVRPWGSSDDGSTFSLTVTISNAHPHDTPQTALDLSDRFSPLLGEGSQTISVEGEWKGATGDAEFEECGGDSSRPGVWFRFRLPLSDSPVVVTVDTCTGTSAGTVLGAFTGEDCTSDPFASSHPHDTVWGALDLSDRFSPLLVEGVQMASVEGDWQKATEDAQFEECGGDSLWPGVWFKLLLPHSIIPLGVTVDTCSGRVRNTVIGVLTGAECSSDSSACECKGWNEGGCDNGMSRVSLVETGGSDLFVVVRLKRDEREEASFNLTITVSQSTETCDAPVDFSNQNIPGLNPLLNRVSEGPFPIGFQAQRVDLQCAQGFACFHKHDEDERWRHRHDAPHPADTIDRAIDLSPAFHQTFAEGELAESVSGHWDLATGDGEFRHCGGSTTTGGVWYTLRLPPSRSTAIVSVDTCGGTASGKTVIGVMSGPSCLSDPSDCKCEGWDKRSCGNGRSRVNGTTLSFGGNKEGQLGRHVSEEGEDNDWRALPVEGLDGETVVGVACGGRHGAAWTEGGKLFMWGGNENGQLGLNDTEIRWNATPVNAPLLEGEFVTQAALGGAHTVIACKSGRVFSWGANEGGQLGNGKMYPGGTGADEHSPVEVLVGDEGERAVSVAAGSSHSLILTSSQKVFAFGRNNFGQLGLGGIFFRPPSGSRSFRGGSHT
uniref:Uncharacterized protein n=1 Tax=Chromera velia CCMP2878 TaxID=1169474 RepID=A0A0G4HQ07_9ALVE|eukprot:Cvel_7841.t1-p1 / transcript=Cvel_7841.t1 / gene=Cvel_7841 / organism=Chromera_velia_CCMP2878 / gene_product=Probable E3 ubiquitin-protein ligase HERC3, putative / transcript_product=Probable E3 ubiquitin-protein ligase HERC3, putative / location=Cvel_scaffold419:49392-55912(-) / protein_length=828 / sequence_SO=supercontig / SO=protein_coding / is_pseudo=false